MAKINDIFSSILTKAAELSQFKFVHIWNNQLDQMEDGQMYSFPFPNLFVELQTPPAYLPLALGYSISDFVIRFHIGHEEYDAGGGLFEQNTNVFSYRNDLIQHFTNFQPTGASSMMKSAEYQDYAHTNIYHYIVEFRCSFVDDAGVNTTNDVEGEITDIIFDKEGTGNPLQDVTIETNLTNQENIPYRKFEL